MARSAGSAGERHNALPASSHLLLDPPPAHPLVLQPQFDDTVHCILYQRPNAEIVAVWSMRNGNDWPANPVPGPTASSRYRGADKAAGIDDYGHVRPWCAQYRDWNP